MKKINLTEQQKKIINIVVTCVQIAIVILAITASIIILVNPNVANGEVSKSKTKLLPVLTDSMAGDNEDSFNKGDLIIAKTPKDAEALVKGDIITYKMVIGTQTVLNTHRIVEKNVDYLGKTYFITRGDNNPADDTDWVYTEEVLAVYSGKLKGVGSAIYWLQKPTNILLVIVLPLVLLFAYNVFLFVRMIMQAKISKVKEESAALSIDEEEIKRKAIAEYLATQNAGDSAEGTKSADDDTVGTEAPSDDKQ